MGIVLFCLLVCLNSKLGMVRDNYATLEKLQKTHHSINSLTKKLNKKNAIYALFNQIEMFNAFRKSDFFDAYMYYLCSPNLKGYLASSIDMLDHLTFNKLYLYFSHYSLAQHGSEFLDFIANQLSEVNLKAGLSCLLNDLVKEVRDGDKLFLREMLEMAMAEELLDGITEFLTSYEQLKKELFLFGF